MEKDIKKAFLVFLIVEIKEKNLEVNRKVFLIQ